MRVNVAALRLIIPAALVIHAPLQSAAPPNYDESQVPSYALPDPLRSDDGSPVRSVEDWLSTRRPEILRLFETEMYGKVPARDVSVTFKQTGSWPDALNGKATMVEVTAEFSNERGRETMNILLFIPNDRSGPVPAFVGLNFYGNHTTSPDPRISIHTKWVKDREDGGIVNNRATEASRGVRVHRWPFERIIDRGYAVATIYYGDLDPDFDDGFQNGVHPLFYEPGQSAPRAEEWGAIGVWAWGLSRAMDYFEADERIDAKRVAVVGHSRLGKAALWAGARDGRFAIVISNNSGCGGAALSRRRYGERVDRITERFPHWFNANFKTYGNREDELPIDQHQLITLIAPRGVYVASAFEDRWADPKGEFLSLVHAAPVFEFLGEEPLATSEQPAVDTPLMTRSTGYHLRSGKHDLTAYDWEMFMDFADQRFSVLPATPRSR